MIYNNTPHTQHPQVVLTNWFMLFIDHSTTNALQPHKLYTKYI